MHFLFHVFILLPSLSNGADFTSATHDKGAHLADNSYVFEYFAGAPKEVSFSHMNDKGEVSIAATIKLEPDTLLIVGAITNSQFARSYLISAEPNPSYLLSFKCVKEFKKAFVPSTPEEKKEKRAAFEQAVQNNEKKAVAKKAADEAKAAAKKIKDEAKAKAKAEKQAKKEEEKAARAAQKAAAAAANPAGMYFSIYYIFMLIHFAGTKKRKVKEIVAAAVAAPPLASVPVAPSLAPAAAPAEGEPPLKVQRVEA